ncbi:MAG: CPBP family glutamic-type intramembrane protease [Nanoarchaeota archaeon]
MNSKLFRDFVAIAGLFLIFFQLNLDPRATPIFLGMIFLIAILFITDQKISLQIERDPSKRLRSLALAVGGFFALMVLSMIVSKLPFSMQSIENILITFAEDSPILSGNPWFLLVFTGILISAIETIFLGIYFEFLAIDKWKARLSFDNLNFWLGAIFLSGIFMLLHLQARFLQAFMSSTPILSFNTALIITFLFGLLTFVLIVLTKDLLAAILLHILTNSITIIKTLPQLYATPTAWIIWGVVIVLAGIIYLSTKIRFTRNVAL